MGKFFWVTLNIFFYLYSNVAHSEATIRDRQLLCTRTIEGQKIEFVIHKSVIDEQHQKLRWQLTIVNPQSQTTFEQHFKREKIISLTPETANNFFFSEIIENDGEVFLFKSLGEVMGDEAYSGAVLEVSFNSPEPNIKKVIFKAAIAQTPHQMIEGELVGTLWIQTKDFAEKVGDIELSCRSTFPITEKAISNR